jgi:hypothetical protein
MRLRFATAQRRFVKHRFPGAAGNGSMDRPPVQYATRRPSHPGDAVMRLILATALAVLAVPQAHAGARTHYLELINRAHDSITSLAIAPSGEAVFRDVALGGALRGGGGSTTVEVAAGTCRYDLRLGFRNGRTAIYREFDVCRHGRLRIGKLPRG